MLWDWLAGCTRGRSVSSDGAMIVWDRLKVNGWMWWVIMVGFIIFIEIGICTAREHPSTAGEGAVTARATINRKLPRREEGPACAWRKLSVSTPNNTWSPSAQSTISKSTNKSSITSTTIMTACSHPWIFVSAFGISEGTNQEDHSSTSPCPSSILTMEVKSPSTSS